jgi:hypothetical protein
MTQRWEYYVETLRSTDINTLKSYLDDIGEDGWELVAVRNEFYYFKRQKLDRGQIMPDAKSEEPTEFSVAVEFFPKGRKFRD